MYMPGATAVGISYNDGIVIASERRIAYGNFVVSKNTKKTFVLTPKVGAACAGLVADMQIQRRFFPLLTQVIVGGVVDKPTIYTLDPLGSVLPDDYAAVGTGAEMALGILDQQYKKEIQEIEAINLAVKSIRSAINRDSASGEGIDVLVINKDGIKETTEKIN